MNGKQNEIRVYTGAVGTRVFVNDEEINTIGCVSAELYVRACKIPQLHLHYLSDETITDRFISEPEATGL